MLNKRLLKFRYIANFSIFAGIVPVGISGVAISSVKNFTDVNGLNKSESVSKNTLRFGDKYISLRSNPMNNFVSLTTTKIGSGNIKEQFTYALCDTATSQEGIKYGKNSGIAKLDYNGNVVALWTLPKTGRGQENEYIYTTNIVFGDTEETVYVLCGISNPAQALNSVYRGANVPTKINYDASANLQDPDTAYFHRNELLPYAVFNRDNTNKYKVDITGYSFANYPKIKIYKLNANDLTGATKYDFEFPPAATGNLNDPLNAFNEYDKTIIAGFGGGQHLNYWSTNSTWVTDYKVKNDHDKMSLMNSSFFHYLQFGQTFDYVGNSQFMMVPTYVGIDPNLGGLYSLVNEGMTRSLASFSSYPSLYNVFYKYKGKPSVNTGTKTIDFSQDAVNSTQYQYLDGSGKKVNVTKGSEFALDESVIRLILLSIGYFLPNHQWNIDAYGVNMEEVISTSTAGYLLSSYGVIGFSPSEPDVVNRYKLYVFNRNNSFGIPAGQFIIKSMIVNYISLRSNPMNNFVSLTTTKLGSGDIKEQFIYLLCDTATSQEGIRYGKNSGIAKLDYNGNVKALWTLPNTGKGQENEYIYTTNIVFDDTEETVYALCGISNPAAALNSVYGNAVVPTKINYGENTNFKDKNTAYFYRNNLAADQVFQRDLDSNYKVDITNYSFANYPKIKIYKLNANNLTQTTKYDFEFPPAATGNLNDPSTAFNEYDKTIIAGFGGGQHLNYWSTNSTWVTDYKTKSNELISLMNSSFFHYLQFGQTFDYVGNEQFMMVPTYMGIDPNLGGLYSLVNEGMTCSLSSFSSYPSLYNVFYKYKGKPSVNTITETVDFSNNTIARTSYQYQYLDGLGKKVDVTIDSEFALKESVINLILLSIGYFLPNHEWRVDDYDVDMEKVDIMYSPGFVLSVYGIICFSPLKKTVLNKYKLYVFNRYNKEYDEIEGWIISTSQFVIKNVFISKNDRGEKRYTFFSGNDYFSWHQTDLPDFYNSAVTSLFLYGTKNPMKEKRPFGFTWNEFASTYDSIRHSQLTFGYEDIKLTGVNGNSKYWFEYNDDDKEYYDNLDSILTTKEYNIDLKYPLGWHTDGYQFNDKGNLDVFSSKKDYRNQYSEFSSWSGSKYISYDNNKIIISDPIWANRLVVIDDVRKFCVSLKKDYDKSYSYNEYCDSAESFNRISTLFSLPGNIGFCYLTYNNEIKICFLGSEALDRQLKNDDFYILSSARKELSSFHSVVPVGKMLFTSVINSDKTISNGYFDINGNSSNDNTDVNGNSNGGIDANSDNIQVGNGANIWIITGICFATLMFVIALGLGIGIIVKRNLKLQLVNIKLSNKKIDMLSTITAKTLRRITENTNNLLENKRKNLITGVFVKPMKPVKPSRQIRPIQPIQSIRSAQPMQLIQPIRLIQPMRMMKSITFTKSSKPSTKVIFADSTKQTKYLSKK